MYKNNKKGDFFPNRLFLSLLQHGVEVQESKTIKPHVFTITTKEKKKVIKGYSSIVSLQKQLHFLHTLKRTGFLSTSYPDSFPSGASYIEVNNRYWLITDYIEHLQPFDFSSRSNRLQAILLLEQYHLYAFQMPPFVSPYITNFNWYEKWSSRVQRILKFRKEAERYIGEQMVADILAWSFFALEKLRNIGKNELFPLSFIHGDIIDHNFVQSNKGLYIIDFDCVSIGPVAYDYVKYCQCILPFINWSYDALYEHPPLIPFLKKPWFLLALLLPNDLLREWSYFLSLPEEEKVKFEKNLVTFTNKNFALRAKFVQKLYNMVT
ncbi:phosphotransferase [Bacillus sp. 165]|uniref:phosphotransferase n=1 Tax=Bacillus sp. 165 TaxID=1529117 RepID=UPI001ADD32A7|nr:phosphotransferase [Bacillus sp. 165]MBO9130487.1 phosphotransferase [Bacillus sp. 165]